MTYEYIRLYMLKDEKIFKNMLKNSSFNILVIGTFYALGSYYITYKPKEEIAAIYEEKFQKEIIKKTQIDVLGNVKEKKRINLYASDKKE